MVRARPATATTLGIVEQRQPGRQVVGRQVGVGVQQQHHLESSAQLEVLDTGGQRPGLAAVRVELQDVGAGGSRDVSGGVVGSVGDDVDVRRCRPDVMRRWMVSAITSSSLCAATNTATSAGSARTCSRDRRCGVELRRASAAGDVAARRSARAAAASRNHVPARPIDQNVVLTPRTNTSKYCRHQDLRVVSQRSRREQMDRAPN